MSSGGFRERGFVPQGRFEASSRDQGGSTSDGSRSSTTRGFRGTFNPSRRNDRPQMDIWQQSTSPQSYYQQNQSHNSSQSWQNRGRFQGNQGNVRQPFRGVSSYSLRGTRGSFARGTSGFRFPNGRGGQNQNQNADYRWRSPYRDFQSQNDKPEDPGPPLLGSEEERRQKITDAVDELKRKLLCNDGSTTDDVNLWDDDFNIPGPEPDDEGTLKGLPELMHGPPEITLTTSDLKDIGRVDVDSGQKSTDIDEDDCEIIDVAKSVRTFSEITIHDDNNYDTQKDTRDSLPEVEADFSNDECFEKSTKKQNFDNMNIISNIDGIINEKSSLEDHENSSKGPEKQDKVPENEEKLIEISKSKSASQDVNFSSSISPCPVDFPHSLEPPQHREPSPDNSVERENSKISTRENKRREKREKRGKKETISRGWPVELNADSISASNSPIDSRDQTNLNFPPKNAVNVNHPPETSFTPPLPPNRGPRLRYDIFQPPPVFDPRVTNNELPMGNLMHDYNAMCPGGYPMPSMMNLPSMDYNMASNYGPMTPFVPMNYPPVISSLDYPSPMAPPPNLNNNLNSTLNPSVNSNLNQIPMPANPPPVANEDDAFRELRRAMEFAQELMGMGESDEINFQKECENGFDNFPTLPDLPPPLPPLPVPESPKRLRKSKKKKEKDCEETPLPPVSEILASAMAAASAAAAAAVVPSSSPSNTPPPRNISTTPPIAIKKEMITPTKEDREKVTVDEKLQSKKWQENVISVVPEARIVASAESCQSAEKPNKLEKNLEKSDDKIQPQTLDLMDLLRSSQFDSLNLFPSPSSNTSRPSYTPEPPGPVPVPSTSKKPQEASWKDRVIGRFLRMSKNDIKNMINHSNLRKFDIAMQHLVKEKKSSLSLEMRNTEDERIKSKDTSYDKEDFIHQLKQILDPAATVDISDLPTNFIHQLNQVLQLDVLPQEDINNETIVTTLSNPETTNTTKIDELYQNNLSLTFGINAPVISTSDTFKSSKIDKRVSKDTTKSLATCSESIVNVHKCKRTKNSTIIDNNQAYHQNNQVNSSDSSLSSQVSVNGEAGALIMDELDDIFTAGINRIRIPKNTTQTVKQTSTFNNAHNYSNNSIITPIVDKVDRIFNSGIAKAKANSSVKCDERTQRLRKNSSDLDFFRNLTKEEYDARHGESSHSSHDNPYRIMNPKQTKKLNDQINGESDHDVSVKTHQSPRLQNNFDENSSDDISNDEYDSASSSSSSGSSDESSDEPSIDVSRMLRFIKEREKIAKKKSLNEEIRDEVTAEIERKRREKRAHREHRARSKKKDKKGRDKHRRDKHRKSSKKKKKRRSHSGDENYTVERLNNSSALLTELEIKKEPEDELNCLKNLSSPQIQRKRVIGPKCVMAKAALMQQEEPKSINPSFSISTTKSCAQGNLSIVNSVINASGITNPSPTIASPSRHSPPPSSPNSSCSTTSQSANHLLRTKAQLKQMPEVIKRFDKSSEVFRKGSNRGPSTPPLQVRPINELLKKNTGVEAETVESEVSKIQIFPPISGTGPPVWGQIYQSSGAFERSLERSETAKSPLRIAEHTGGARFNFLQRNKFLEGKDMSLSSFSIDHSSSLRLDGDLGSSLQISPGTVKPAAGAGGAGGTEGVKSTCKPKKLDIKEYKERALLRKLRAEGKLPPLLEKIVPRESSENIRNSLANDINKVSAALSFNDSASSTATSSPPVLVKEIITKNIVPSEEVKHRLTDNVKAKEKYCEISAPQEKIILAKIQIPEVKINNNNRSMPGPLSSKRRKNEADGARREDNVSPPAEEINAALQPEKLVEKSGVEENVVKKSKRLLKKRQNKFGFYFRICSRIISDGLPDVVPVESLPECRIEDSEGIVEKTGEIGAKNLNLMEKIEIGDEIIEKLPELHMEKSGDVEDTLLNAATPEMPELSSINALEPQKSLKIPSIAAEITSNLHKSEEINSLNLLKVPVNLDNELQVHPALETTSETPGPPESQFLIDKFETTQVETKTGVSSDSLVIPDLPEPLQSPLTTPPTPETPPEEVATPGPSNLPRETRNSSIENFKEADLNERNDLASLRADEATWRVDPNHLDPENLHHSQSRRDSKENEISFAESQRNWQLEAEISTEESRKNVVLHDRALVVDTPRNSILDDPIAFATSNNSPANEGETADEFGILCDNDIEGSIYDNQLAEGSPIDMIDDSSVPMRTSFTPDGVAGDLNDEDLNCVGIVDRELMEVGRKSSPSRLPSLILQGMVRDVEEGVKTPESERRNSVIDEEKNYQIDGTDVETAGIEDGVHQEAATSCKLPDVDDKSLAEGEEAETNAIIREESFIKNDSSVNGPEECIQIAESEPEMLVLAPEDVENSLNSLAAEKAEISQSIETDSLENASKIENSAVIHAPTFEIDSSSSSGPSPTPSGPSPLPEEKSALKTDEQSKSKSKDENFEKSKNRESKKSKDFDSLRKLNKSSTPNRDHKKHKHHDKKKSKITEKRFEEAIKSDIVVLSQPKTKIGVMARMRDIDIAIQNLMNEKMTLYQMLQNDEWPIQPEFHEPSATIEQKSKLKSTNSREKLIGKKSPKVVVSRLPEPLENKNQVSETPSKSVPSEPTFNDHTKNLPAKNLKNENLEKRLGPWEDKMPHKAKKRVHSKEDNEVIKPKEARREGATDSSHPKTSDDSTKKEKKSKNHEEMTKKPVKLSQLIGRDFKPKPSSQKPKLSSVGDEKGRNHRSKSVEKSSGILAKHKNESEDTKKKKKSSHPPPEYQPLFYSDDSTLDSADRITNDQRKTTGLALLEERMKREVGMKKKQETKKSKDSILEDEEPDFPKLMIPSLKKKPIQKKSNIHGKKSGISEASGAPKTTKHVQDVIDTVVKNRVSKKPQKVEKMPEIIKKKLNAPEKSRDPKASKIDGKLQKKPEIKLNLIDSDSSSDDFSNPVNSNASRTHVKTPSRRLEDSSDEKNAQKECSKDSKKPDKSDIKSSHLKDEILGDWSDSSSDSLKPQRDKKTSRVSKSIIEDSEDEMKTILQSEKHQKSKQNDFKSSKSYDKRPKSVMSDKRSKSVMSDKLKSNSKDLDKKSKDSEKLKPKEIEKSSKEIEKTKEKFRNSSRNGDESPIEGDDEDEDISIKRKGTSKRSKKISSRRSNKSSSRSRSRSKRALQSSSRDSSPGVDLVKKRPRSGSSTSSRNSRRRSFTSRTEPHPNKHKRRQQFVEKSREEMINCRVKLIDCKYLLSLRPEGHPQTFRRLGITRINPWIDPKCVILSDEKSRSEDDCHSMIVVEVDDNVESSSAVELIEEGIDGEEDNISEKSACLGFPTSPEVEELAKGGQEELEEETGETQVMGVSEGDVEMIEIKEEPIMRADSISGDDNGVEEVNQEEKGDDEEPSNVEDKDRMRYTVHKGPILDIKVFGDSFLAASEDGAIYRYCQTSNGILNIYQGHEAAVTCLYVHEIPGITDCKKWFLFSGSLDASLRCYDVMGGILNRPKVTVGSPIQCMDEAWGSIFIGTKSGHISRYDIKTGSLREDKLDFSDKPVLALRASTEGPRKILIVASRNQPITIRDAQSGLFLRTIAGQRTHTVYSLMRDRNLVYCGTSSTSIPVFDFISGDQVTQFTAGVGIVCMRLYKQLLFAGCYDGNIYVFDTKEPKLICSIPGPGNMLLSMEVVDDTIIAGSKDRSLHAWRMPPSVRTILLDRT